jgi:CHAT domain-containing protein/predicted negative regulator of RcsB-dependent stress response
MTRRPIPIALVALALAATGAGGQTRVTGLVRETPDAARDSIATALRAAVRPDPDTAAARVAVTVARAYLAVWGDPFLAERVRWVLALPPVARQRFLEADSLRAIGNRQMFGTGPAPARATWRRAGRRFAEIGDTVGMTLISGNIGAAFYEEGSLDSATWYLKRAAQTAERIGDRRTAGNAATILGNVAWERGDLRTAIEHNVHAADLHRATADFSGMAADHNNAGLIAEDLGDLQAAERHYRAALDIAERRVNGKRAADYLVNLGEVAGRQGDLDTARAYFARALELYRGAGEPVNEALVHRNLGMLLAGVSSYDDAVAEYRRAISLSRRGGDIHGEVEVERLLASAYSGLGRPDEALEEIGHAEERLAAAPPDNVLAADVGVVRGDIELMLNRDDEAATRYEAAARRYRAAGDMDGLAAAALGRAQLELRRSRYDEVVRLLVPVAAAQPEGRDRAWTHLLLGVAYGERGDTADARESLLAAQRESDRWGDRVGVALALASLARLKAHDRQPEGARALLLAAQRRAAGVPAVQWWLQLDMGEALEAAGDVQQARIHYDSSITLVESLADWVRFDDRRATFLEDKWEPYAVRARLEARAGQTSSALASSEQLRARYLLDLLARHRPVSYGEGALRAQERQLSARIGDLTAQLLADDNGRRGAASVTRGDVREDLLVAQASYRRLLDQMRAEEPEYLRALRGETVSPSAIQNALGPHDLLLEYLVADDQLWIFAVTDTGLTQLSVAVGRQTLRTQIDFARWALEQRSIEESLWRSALRGLDDLLLEPVRRAGLLTGRREVIVVPHLELHYLPFEALIDRREDGDHYFVEAHDVTYVPSASVWLRMRARPLGHHAGVLALAPLDARLQGTAREVEAIRNAWGDEATVRRGAAATEESLRHPERTYRIVHLATRGILNRYNPLFSYVDLRPAGATDGRLEVHEVFRLVLDTDLLVLSACQTGLGAGSVADVPAGDDWVGLVRAFMQAGARNVMATLWAVDDVHTAEVAGAFHRLVAAGESYAHALAEVKRAAIRHTATSNPYYWAGLVLTGTP